MVRNYSPYGVVGALPPTTLAFCGQRRDPLSGNYSLGNGYRHYSPTLMRFLSPDSLSPFAHGGINAYAYCGGDPVNRTDESGRFWIQLLTQVAFGTSAVAGIGNIVVSRMRARINNVSLPAGVVEPPLPQLHPRVVAFANVADAYAYMTSVVLRGPQIGSTVNPAAVLNIQPALDRADLGRAVAGSLGYAALPMNAMHEWRRAGVRGMPRAPLIGGALLDAYGLSYAWQGVRHVTRAAGSAVSGAIRGLVRRIRGLRRPVDVEADIEDTRL